MSIIEIIKAILTGGAYWQFYYIIILLQLVILTPLLLKLAERKLDWIVYVIGILSIGFDYCVKLEVIDIQIPINLCFSSLPIYYLGIRLRMKGLHCICKKFSIKASVGFVIAAFTLSCIEGTIFYVRGNYTIAMTQGKFSSWIYAVSIIMLFCVMSMQKNRLISGLNEDHEEITEEGTIIKRWLGRVGDYSYGIFYCHCLFLIVIDKAYQKFLGKLLPSIVYLVSVYALVVGLSFLFCLIANKVIGKRLSKIFGVI